MRPATSGTYATVARCYQGPARVARMLVYLGADPDALDDQHDTPWLVTGVTGSVDMLEVLLPAEPM